MLYSYEAKDHTGRTVTGSLEAPNERVAAQQIQGRGYFVLRISPLKGAVSAGVISVNGHNPALAPHSPVWRQDETPSLWKQFLTKAVYPVWSGVPPRDIAVLFRQMAALENAGVPLFRSLTTVNEQTSNPTLKRCIRALSRDVEAGGMLSEAMQRFPWIFTEFHRSMIVAGEKSGRLDLMLMRLADALEQEYTLKSNIKREMFMPGITIAACFLLPPLFMLFLGEVRGYLQEAVVPIVGAIAIVTAVYVLTRLTSQFRVFYDGLAASLPAIGGAVRMIMLARFARVLATLYAAGVNISDSIRYAAGAGGNAYLGGRIMRALPFIESGHSMVESLGRTFVFPPLVMSMLGTGEETGSLDQMMNKVADYYEQESKVRLHQLSISITTIVTILVAIRVLIIVLKFYTGYFHNVTNIGDN